MLHVVLCCSLVHLRDSFSRASSVPVQAKPHQTTHHSPSSGSGSGLASTSTAHAHTHTRPSSQPQVLATGTGTGMGGPGGGGGLGPGEGGGLEGGRDNAQCWLVLVVLV